MTPQLAKPFTNAPEYEAIMRTMQNYIEGGRMGKSDIMRPGFHSAATIVGYCGGTLLTGLFSSFSTGLMEMALHRTSSQTLPALKFCRQLP